jgi:hypothetical protein
MMQRHPSLILRLFTTFPGVVGWAELARTTARFSEIIIGGPRSSAHPTIDLPQQKLFTTLPGVGEQTEQAGRQQGEGARLGNEYGADAATNEICLKVRNVARRRQIGK